MKCQYKDMQCPYIMGGDCRGCEHYDNRIRETGAAPILGWIIQETKTFKLFLLLLYVNIKLSGRDLKKKIKKLLAGASSASRRTGMLFLIITPHGPQKGLSQLTFLLDLICTLIIFTGAGTLLLSFAQWIIGNKKNSCSFLLIGSAAVLIGLLMIIFSSMIK